MQRSKVKSSNIKSVGYDPKELLLEVEFVNGQVYQYLRVPQGVHADLMKSESVGRFFAAEIKSAFKFRKAQPEQTKAEPTDAPKVPERVKRGTRVVRR